MVRRVVDDEPQREQGQRASPDFSQGATAAEVDELAAEYARNLIRDNERDAAEVRNNPTQWSAALAATCDEELNARDVYGDGDQSFLSDERGRSGRSKAQPLRDMWSAGGDSFDKIASNQVSAFWLACFTGSVAIVEDAIVAAQRRDDDSSPLTAAAAQSQGAEGSGREAVKKLLERRETQMRFSPLFAAITGARIGVAAVGGPAAVGASSPSSTHLEVARLLVDAGANVQAKDVAGYAPLAHCTSGVGDMAKTLEIAMRVLGPAGADPNAVNRFGVPPLEDALMTGRADTLTARTSFARGGGARGTWKTLHSTVQHKLVSCSMLYAPFPFDASSLRSGLPCLRLSRSRFRPHSERASLHPPRRCCWNSAPTHVWSTSSPATARTPCRTRRTRSPTRGTSSRRRRRAWRLAAAPRSSGARSSRTGYPLEPTSTTGPGS